MKYDVLRTDTADANIREIVLYVAESFGKKFFAWTLYGCEFLWYIKL